MTYRLLTQLADILRAADQTVVEIDGWQSRGRPVETGGFFPNGILWHHTGPGVDGLEGSTWMAEEGRDDLPPPLVQLSVGRDGVWYVLAAGRANHAGWALASGPMPEGDGNEMYLGVEVQNSGTEGYSTAQYKAMLLGGAALTHAYGWLAESNRGHKETSTEGKWDPGLLDMNRFRSDLADTLNGVGDYALAYVAPISYQGEQGYWLPALVDIWAGLQGSFLGGTFCFTAAGVRRVWSRTDGSVWMQDGSFPPAGQSELVWDGTPVQIQGPDPGQWSNAWPMAAYVNPDGSMVVRVQNDSTFS